MGLRGSRIASHFFTTSGDTLSVETIGLLHVRHVISGGNRNGSAVCLKRCRTSFKYSHYFQTTLTTRQRRRAAGNAVEEMSAHLAQRLRLVDAGDVTIAIMIGVLEFAKTVVMGRAFDTRVVNPDLFNRLDIVINQHLAGSDNGHLADFPGFQPTALDGGELAVLKNKRNIRDIFNSGSDMGI